MSCARAALAVGVVVVMVTVTTHVTADGRDVVETPPETHSPFGAPHHVDLRDPIELAGLFQGDIVLSAKSPSIRLATTDPARRWEGGVIPYIISSSYDASERATIAKAMDEIQRSNCLHFIPRAQQVDYIHLLKAHGCSSAVGRAGGPQQVTLGPSCLFVGVVIHELLHVAGFWHEHSRGDRDNYITINKANVQSGMWYNFQKYSWDEATSLGVEYDLDSVMHYGPYAFAKDRSRPTIIPQVRGTEMGQRRGLSQRDTHKLRKLYGCGGVNDLRPAHAATTTTTITAAANFGSCQDLHEHCQSWAATGECAANPNWMHQKCRKTCGQCAGPASGGAACQDQHEHCEGWARRGECRHNPDYMLPACPAACGQC